jgi:hypothetical protein
MANVSNRPGLDDLRREVGRICDGKGAFQDVTEVRDFRAYEPAPPDSRLREMGRTEAPADRGPFGRWLMRQEGKTDAMRMLVDAAKRDPQFPRDGDPEAVRARLRVCMAEGDLFDAVDDAEMDWMSF